MLPPAVLLHDNVTWATKDKFIITAALTYRKIHNKGQQKEPRHVRWTELLIRIDQYFVLQKEILRPDRMQINNEVQANCNKKDQRCPLNRPQNNSGWNDATDVPAAWQFNDDGDESETMVSQWWPILIY